jgi:DNA-binding NarL/FixJ family response regulator
MTTPGKIRLLLVDDHFVVRSGLAASLALEDDLEVVAEACDAVEAVALFEEHRPDVVLMDLQLGGSSGVGATAEICRGHPGARILVFSSFARDEDIYQAIRAGALGYVGKSAPRQELLDAVRRVAGGGRWLGSGLAERLAGRLARPEPSPREMEILRRIAGGRSNKEAAGELGISEDTVKRHVTHLMAKLGVQDRTQAVTEALRRGLLDL